MEARVYVDKSVILVMVVLCPMRCYVHLHMRIQYVETAQPPKTNLPLPAWKTIALRCLNVFNS